MSTEIKNEKEGVKKPHPAPDPTHPGKGKPGTKIPVSPDEDNDFSIPSPETGSPDSPAKHNVPAANPGPDENPSVPKTPADPNRISPAKPGQPVELLTVTNRKIIFMLLFSFLSFGSYSNPAPVTPEKEPVEITIMKDRLMEIKEMDKEHLTSSEKKALRQEVRSIKKKMAETSGGIYLSAGAVIIILLLLIIFL